MAPRAGDGPSAPWVDSHCHVQDFDDVDGVLDAAEEAGVGGVLVVGTDLEASRRAVDLAARRSSVWASVGLHPHEASRFDEEWEALAELAREPRVVGVGESGFDLHHRHSPEGDQERAFRAHVALAGELGRALVIHTREAWPQTFRVLEEEGVPSRTVFHCFTGGPAEAERALGLGAHLSFSGIVSFPGASEVREAAALAPLGRVLVETDAPYLAPVPHRGQRNEPRHVVRVGEALAGAAGTSAEEVASATTSTARALFDLPLPPPS